MIERPPQWPVNWILPPGATLTKQGYALSATGQMLNPLAFEVVSSTSTIPARSLVRLRAVDPRRENNAYAQLGIRAAASVQTLGESAPVETASRTGLFVVAAIIGVVLMAGSVKHMRR